MSLPYNGRAARCLVAPTEPRWRVLRRRITYNHRDRYTRPIDLYPADPAVVV